MLFLTNNPDPQDKKLCLYQLQGLLVPSGACAMHGTPVPVPNNNAIYEVTNLVLNRSVKSFNKGGVL